MDEEKIILTLEADDEASEKIDNVSKSLRNLGKESNNLNGNGIADMASNIEKGINRINSVTRHYNSTMSGFNRTVIGTIKDMGSAIYDFTSESIDNFTQFSEQHAKVLGAMAADYDNTSASQAKFFQDSQKLKEQAMQIGTYGINGKGSLITIPEVSQAQESLVKAGISADDIASSNVLQDVLTFAQANDMDIDSAVETAVTLGNQFDIDSKDWGSMLDKISHTADMSVVDVSDITTSLKWASGISSGLDRDLEETLGMLTILGDFGLKGSQAGTGIQALLTRLLTGDTTVITAAQAEIAPGNALEKFYEFEKIAKPDGNLLPMADVIDELNIIMEDMTDEEQAWFAKKLFGLYQMKSAYALINGDDVNLDDIIDEIEKQSDGTNENKLEQLLSSQYGQLTSLNNLWDGIKTDVGDRLSPFIDAVRDELFTFLSSDGNYNINFDNLRDALDESCDLIEEKYGSAIADAVRNIGDATIDLTQVMEQLAPELGSGLSEFFGSLFNGDIVGAASDWNEMIANMKDSAQELPEDLRDLGETIASTIDWFGKLIALNVVSEIAELISSVLQILTIAGGAVINVAGAIVVNGNTVGGGGGTGTGGTGAGTTGAATTATATATGAATSGVGSALSGSTVVGSADDVAKALGTTTDDIAREFGKHSLYTIDDIASGFGASADDVISAFGSSLDDVVKAGVATTGAGSALSGSTVVGSIDDVTKVLGTTADDVVREFGKHSLYTIDDIASGFGASADDVISTFGSSLDDVIKAGTGSLDDVVKAGAGSLDDVVGGIANGGSKAFGALSKTGKALGVAGIALQVGTSAYEAYRDFRSGDTKGGFEAIGGGVGSISGGLGGTALGTMISPGLGTIIGAVGGSIAGDYLGRNFAGGVYSNMNNAKNNYGTYMVEAIPVVGNLWKTDQNKMNNYADGLKEVVGNFEQEMSKALDGLGGYTAQAWQTSFYYGIDGGRYNNLSDKEKEEFDQIYYKYKGVPYNPTTISDDNYASIVAEGIRQSEETIGSLKELGAQMIVISKNNKDTKDYYDPNLDTLNQGYYNIWTGTDAQLQEYLNSIQSIHGSDHQEKMKTVGATSDNPYMLNNLGEDIKQSITSSVSSIERTQSSQMIDQLAISANSTTLTGEIQIPNIDSLVKQIMPQGWAVLSNQGKGQLVENAINNQIKINDTINMRPAFNVSAPTVNVDVKVDKSGNATISKSILNPSQGTMLNNWYSRVSSQYGKTSK